MIIPLDKLIALDANRYIFSKAAMNVVGRITNVKEYPDLPANWKIVPCILLLLLEGKIKYQLETDEVQTDI